MTKLWIEALRKSAEEQLLIDDVSDAPPQSSEQLLRELQIYQVALEMQNEQLRLSQIELEESRNHFVYLYDCAPVGYFTLTVSAEIAAANLTGAEMLGVERNKLIGTSFASFVAPHDRDRLHLFFQNMLRSAQPLSCDLQLNHDEGSVIYVRIDCLQSKEDKGSICIALIDTTEQTQAAISLKNENKKNQLLLRNASDGVHILDFAGNVIEASDTFCAMIGYRHDEIIGINVSQWDAQFSEAELTEMGRQLFAQKKRIQFETRHQRKDGTVFDVEVSSFPLELEGKAVMFCSSREISERKKLDGAFREQESLLRKFIDHAPAALAMFDLEMNYISVSKRWIEDYSLGDMDIIGRSHYEIFPEIQDEWKEVHRRGMAGEVIRAEEDHFVRSDGSLHWLKWEVQPWHTASGHVGGIIIYSESITELKRIELQLHELAAHLQNVRDEEKTTIASEIHDDLGGTLTSIRMAAHTLRYAILEEKDKQQLLDRASEILKLTDYASGVTRQIVTGLYPTMLDDLGILAALEWLIANFQKNSGLKCQLNNIQSDRDLSNELRKEYKMALFRIAQEALTNVSRHSSASKVEIEFSCAADEVVLSIIDNGRGIMNVEADRTGRFGILGMRERARQLGGRIILETPLGGGLSVTAIFPRSLIREK